MSYRLLPDNESRNTPDTCNNPSCPNPTIYWNPQVVHSRTGKQTPLSEPYNPQVKAPVLHRCMKDHRPGMYINKHEGYEAPKPAPYPRVKASVIICSDPDCNTPIVERTEPLIQQLDLHLKKYHNLKLSEDFTNILQFKIDHLRNGHFAYTDPFLHIPWVDISKNSEKG